jgi:hypothetical protein
MALGTEVGKATRPDRPSFIASTGDVPPAGYKVTGIATGRLADSANEAIDNLLSYAQGSGADGIFAVRLVAETKLQISTEAAWGFGGADAYGNTMGAAYTWWTAYGTMAVAVRALPVRARIEGYQ